MYQGKFQDNVTPAEPAAPQPSTPSPAPQRRPPQRRRRKRTTTGTYLFYSIYVVMVLALFIAIAIIMGALKNWIPTIIPNDQSKELSQAVFDQYFKDPDWAALYKMTYPNATEAAVTEYVQKIKDYIGARELTFIESHSSISGDKKTFKVHVDGIGVSIFTLTTNDPDSTNPTWYFDGIAVELFPAPPVKPGFLTYTIITLPSNTVTVNGEALTEEDIVRKVYTKAEEYLPKDVDGYNLVEYRVTGLDKEPEVKISDKAGNTVETNYSADTKTYTQVMPEAPTISSADAEYQAVLGAAKVWTEYMIKGGTAGLKKYYNPSSQVYKDIVSGEMFRQSFSSYSFHPEEITEYYRYSDTLFSAKIKLDCTVIRKADGYNKLFTVDSTYIFHYVDGKWMVYDLLNVEIQEQIEEVRLTFKDAQGNVLSSEFVNSSVKFLTTPAIEIPEGKTFDGWYAQSFKENGQEVLDPMFTPDANNTVNLAGNKDALKSMVLVPMFVDAQEEA